MKKKFFTNLLMWVLLTVLIILSMLPGFMPWWGFTVTLFITGALLSFLGLAKTAFNTAFLAGFVVWCGGNIYFDATGDGGIFSKIAAMLSIIKPLVFAASGIIGGLLAGLSFYAGRKVFAPQLNNHTL